jgi:hypothetical protein
MLLIPTFVEQEKQARFFLIDSGDFTTHLPAVLFAFAPSDFSPTVTAPPSCRSVNGYCSIIPVPMLLQPKVLVRPHASVVHNVPPLCCEWNLFLLGTCPNSYTRELTLIPPKWSPIPLPITERSAPISFVFLVGSMARDPTTYFSLYSPSCYYLPRQKPKLSLLITLSLHSTGERFSNRPSKTHSSPAPPPQPLPPNLPIANAPAGHNQA